jgi:hypothetical protein
MLHMSSLNRHKQGIVVGLGALYSFSILSYIIEDNCKCKRNRLINQYENKIVDYERQIVSLKDIIYNLEKKTELK